MDSIHAWWEGLPNERFWLGLPRREGTSECLAAPSGPARGTSSESHLLLRHVRDGDAVFHYDPERTAIVAWSRSRGRVRKRRMAWPSRTHGPGRSAAAPEALPSWTIGLGHSTALESIVPLEQIARLQSSLFLSLRALEDAVGEPLYYPFAMGHPTETHVLAGRVFKLPAILVESCPALASAAQEMGWSALARHRASAPAAEAAASVAAGAHARAVQAPAGVKP